MIEPQNTPQAGPDAAEGATHEVGDEAVGDDALCRILTETRVIAVVGVSANPARPSHVVARDLGLRGYRVIPVNPGHAGETILGATVYADLSDIPADIPVDMVDIFRRSEHVPPVVEAAIAHLPHLRTIWMQIGVAHAGAAAAARARGLTVVQNRCPKIECQRLLGDVPPRNQTAGPAGGPAGGAAAPRR